jgi:hypothetical protein
MYITACASLKTLNMIKKKMTSKNSLLMLILAAQTVYVIRIIAKSRLSRKERKKSFVEFNFFNLFSEKNLDFLPEKIMLQDNCNFASVK